MTICEFCHIHIEEETLAQHIYATHFRTIATWYAINNYDITSVLDFNQTLVELDELDQLVELDQMNMSFDLDDQYDNESSVRKIEDIATIDTDKENDICPICLNEHVRKATLKSCNHSFCLSCISSWTIDKRKKTCPICRSNVLSFKDKEQVDKKNSIDGSSRHNFVLGPLGQMSS